MSATSIEWCDHSVNPIRARDKTTGATGHYCQKISSGCANCYASRYQPRRHMPKFPGVGKIDPNIEIYLDEDALKEVLGRRIPTKFFWEDMSDLFGDWVTDGWLHRCFEVMENTPRHTHQVLTKRAKRMSGYLRWRWGEGKIPSRNIWIGCSVENQEQADERIPHLLKCPAAVRFLSCEPLLGEIDLHWLNEPHTQLMPDHGAAEVIRYWQKAGLRQYECGIHWVIAGGESGPGARQCDLGWIRSIIGQCKAADVPVFVKQLGRKPIGMGTGADLDRWAKFDHPNDKGGEPEAWPIDLRVRQFPHAPTGAAR